MPRILVVDDSAINLKLITAALAPTGYEVVTASSGREALERAPAVQPDLIILDVMMPDLNGYDVCRQLRPSRSEDCAVIVSREEQRRQRPAQPSEAWQRVAQRMQQRRQRAS